MCETFKTTYGVTSKAGELVFSNCKGKERKAFFVMLRTYLKEMRCVLTPLQCKLLLDFYQLKNIENEGDFYSYRNNVFKTIFNQRIKHFHKIPRTKFKPS